MVQKSFGPLIVLISVCVASMARVPGNAQTKERENRLKSHVNPVNLDLDEASAVKIAEVICVRVYGERVLAQKPWVVKMEQAETVFHISGTPRTKYGGVVEIRLQRSNAEVVSIRHGK